jgi:hypothetical protein
MTRSGIKEKWDYRSMLVGNLGYLPLNPSMFTPGEGSSTAINKMPFNTETFSTLSATLTFSAFTLSTAFSSNINGYALLGGSAINKFNLGTETISTLGTPSQLAGTYRGGFTPAAAYYVTNPTTAMSGAIVNAWNFSTDTITTSTALQSFSNIGPFGNYTFSNSPSIYFGGGTPAGPYYYGGLVKFNTSSSTASSVWADATATSRANTSGAENGSTGAYLAGGNSMPYQTFPTNILKISFASDTSYSTLSATLSAARAPARVGVQAGVSAYYASGRSTGGSAAPVLTTVSKLTYSNETVSNVATATVNRTGVNTWNTY